ncbi:transcription factor 23-like [Anomaloglossus baeobatrachus]|uniref:transcription factor 23-like n=1 Tax=Anomaloglossus baeobatrachus TaxID=238106 RepID=UPI003F507FB7
MERTEPREMALTGWQVHVPGPVTTAEGRAKEEALQGGGEQLPVTWGGPSRRGTKAIPNVHKSNQLIPGKQSPENNARERNRVRTLRQAFLSLQAALPSVPPGTKLSKLDVLVLATSYIAHLTHTLHQERRPPVGPQTARGPGYLHPVKKWPMRSRLYAEALEYEVSGGSAATEN